MAKESTLIEPDERAIPLNVRVIRTADLADAVGRGLDDFGAKPTHIVFLCLIYPIMGLVLSRLAFGYDVLPLLFPMIAGFALIGPFAAIGLYEISRRREQGLEVNWKDALGVTKSASFGGIIILGIVLFIIFLCWLYTAQAIYIEIMGTAVPESIWSFAERVLTTTEGWTLIVVGNGVGLLFAVVAMSISVVSFPLLLDRHVGVVVAILTSVKAVQVNPVPMLVWGMFVAGALVAGALPFFIGLAIVMPVLGHSTWHLYRKVVET